MTRRAAPAAATPAASAGGGDLAAWLRTREGKMIAGGGAAALVVLVALMRRGAGADGGGFVPAAMQPITDGTLQGALDQVGGGGGTLAEWINSTDQLNSTVRDLLEAQNPLPSTTPKAKLGPVTGLRGTSNRQDITWYWNPVAGATKYLVELIQGTGTVIKSTTTTRPSFQASPNGVLGLRPGAPYRIRVTPLGDAGAGETATNVYRTRP